MNISLHSLVDTGRFVLQLINSINSLEQNFNQHLLISLVIFYGEPEILIHPSTSTSIPKQLLLVKNKKSTSFLCESWHTPLLWINTTEMFINSAAFLHDAGFRQEPVRCFSMSRPNKVATQRLKWKVDSVHFLNNDHRCFHYFNAYSAVKK